MMGWQRMARPGVALATLATLALVIASLLAGCGMTQAKRLPEPPDMAKDQTLKLSLPSQDGSVFAYLPLDPAGLDLAGYGSSIQPAALLFDTLVTLDRNEQIEPWGATSWTISPDGLTYTFHLRPNQRFSDGAAVKASDYAWSLDRLASPCLADDSLTGLLLGGVSTGPLFIFTTVKDALAFHNEACVHGQAAGALPSLVGHSILPDDSAQTLTIQLAQPSGYFLSAMTAPFASVIERSVVTGANLGVDQAWTAHLADGKTGQGGSGMFYLASVTRGARNLPTELALKPNPHWWGIAAGKTPHFSEVDFLAADASVALDIFKDDLTIAYSGSLGNDQPDRQQPYYHEHPTLYTEALAFNWTTAPFDDLNARKALCLAINREQFRQNQQAYRGDGSNGFHSVSGGGAPLNQDSMIPTWRLVPPGMPGYNAQLRGLDGAPVAGNAALAQQYWQRYLAAHGGKAPWIAMLVRGYPPIEAALAYNWQQAPGVNVHLSQPAFPAAEVVSVNDQMAITFAAINYGDPREAFMWGYSAIARNRLTALVPFGTGVPQADALLQQADAQTDMQQRIPLYQRAEQLLIDNATICPLFQWRDTYALRPWVKGGFIEDARGVFPNDAWVSGYIAKH